MSKIAAIGPPSSSPTAASPTAAGGITTTVKDAIDILLYDDPQGARKRRLILELQAAVQREDFGEEFLEHDGLDVILQQIKMTQGSVQAGLLQVLRGLLVYVNAVDQIADSPDLVDKIYHLLVPPADGSPINLSVAKPTLEILIVICSGACGLLERGHKLVNRAAKRCIMRGSTLPYSPLVPLLACSDLLTIRNTLLFMNIMMKKKADAAPLKAKKLLFRWKEAGLMSLLKPLTAIEDEEIQKQLTVLQKLSNMTIPMSWEEAAKYKAQYEDAKRRYESAADSLFAFQQQQAKMRLLKAELMRAQETIKAMSILQPSMSTHYHPSKRFEEGGGLGPGALLSSTIEPVDSSEASAIISAARKAVFQHFVSAPDFKEEAAKIVGVVREKGGKGKRAHFDPTIPFDSDEDDLGPPPDEELPPPEEDELPPPEDDMLPGGEEALPPPSEELPPPSGDAPPPDEGDLPPDDGDLPPPVGDGGSGAAPPVAQAASAGGLGEVQAGSAAAAVVPTPPTSAPPPPPPPPPPGKFGAPPPPPPGKFGGVGAVGAKKGPAAPSRNFFKGPAPAKKMKPFHWEKLDYSEKQDDSLWFRLHETTEFNVDFDYEEFETLFSQKEAVEKKTVEKKPRVQLLDEGQHRNLAIMLRKLPTIPNIQRALIELDDTVLSRDSLVALVAQAPDQEFLTKFQTKMNLKPLEEYEPPESFVAMAVSMIEFKRRCECWLFTMEWEENLSAAMKPIAKLQEAIDAVLNSRHLPYYMGLLLGFGNMMNYGNAQKGNAPAVSVAALGRLNAAKDNRGKISLLQHLLDVVKSRNPDALSLSEELKTITNVVAANTSNTVLISMDDIDSSVKEAQQSLTSFHNTSNLVKRKLDKAGESQDAFIPKMAEYYVKASEELKQLLDADSNCKVSFEKMRAYFGESNKLKPEDVFKELVPFTEHVKKVQAEMEKEQKRKSKKGKKLDSHLSNVVGKLQEEIVQ